jgi:hypothetical protein
MLDVAKASHSWEGMDDTIQYFQIFICSSLRRLVHLLLEHRNASATLQVDI